MFVQVDDTDFTINGENLVFRGFGIGNWLNIEHFMIGLPGTELQLRTAIQNAFGTQNSEKFWDKYLLNYVREPDFEFMKNLGINSVRLSFNYRHFESDRSPYQYNEKGFTHLDRVLTLCAKYRIYAILDLHAAPGGQNPDWHSDNAIGEALFWEYNDFQKRTIELWKYFAHRYKDNSWIAGYDLMNEACYYKPYGKMVDRFYHKLAAEVRRVDPNHLLFIEGDFYAHFFKEYTPYQDPNIAYSFHYYPSYFTEHSFEEHSSPLSAVEETIMGDGELLYVQNELNRPLWCGETGISSKRGDSEFYQKLLQLTLEVFEKHNFSWSIWTYKDARGMGCVRPKVDSNWMKFSQLASNKWNFSEEFRKYLISNEVLKELNLDHLAVDLQRKLNFRLLANNQLVLTSHYEELFGKISVSEFLAYPNSFKFENCEQWENLVNVIKKFTGS